VVGYPVMWDRPAAARMLDAVAQGSLDAALVWGPQAGWYLSRASVPLTATIAVAPPRLPVPFEFSIAVGVARGNRLLRDAIDAALERRRAELDSILREYAVPRTDVEVPG
jgi:mxaJ protein